MKIAILVKRFTLSGGKERYVVELAKALYRLGHHVDVFAYEAEDNLLDGMGFFRVPNRMTFSSVLNTLSFVRETANMLKDHTYDIVHSHERNYKQEILTLHSFSYCDGLEKYGFIRKIDQKFLSMRSWLYLWLERRQMKSPWLVSVSTAISKDVDNHYGRTGNVVEIPPGVDLTLFDRHLLDTLREEARREKDLGKNDLAILFVGSAFQRKGLDRLIPAITHDMRLFIVGKGDHIPRFKKMAREHHHGQQISFEGITDNVIKYYALADVVVLPSRSEAFGMSVLEGMACGLPVIVSDNSGIADLIQHGDNGFLMKMPSDLPGLLDLMRSEKMRQQVGRCARKTAEQYSWSKVGMSHEAFYKRVLSKKKNRLRK
ncbi:MAG: glycosyltransferase family 4 protein [Desulfobacterales bacterium]|nr:glycosyltransferase family 4 protein [Desulfobacterales bacterium]